MSDIVERLRGLAKAEMFLGAYTEAKSITDAIDEIERLRAALANEQARGVHTCHEHCERPMCVMQRAITERDSMIERLRARLAELETENAICRDAVEDAADLVTGWCDTHDSDSDSSCGRVSLRKLGEAIGKACPRLLMEKPEGQRLYGLHWRELQARLAEAERQYMELIYAVGRKFPGETRHQTALRYIQQAETAEVHAAMAADSAGESRGNV
jgi:hypothetical protein